MGGKIQSKPLILMRRIEKPVWGEYPEYSKIYLDLMADDGKVLEHLIHNFFELKDFIYALPEDLLLFKYAEGKWTIKEILVHLIDDERIFTYRALRNARNDETPVNGFDQELYTEYSGANDRSLDSIFEEYEAVRFSTIELFKHLPEEAFLRKGTGIDYDGKTGFDRTVRGLAYHIAGHELRHFNIIKERYVANYQVLPQ